MSQIKGEEHLMELNKTVNFVCKKYEKHERERMNVTGPRKRKLPVSCRKMLMICLQQ